MKPKNEKDYDHWEEYQRLKERLKKLIEKKGLKDLEIIKRLVEKLRQMEN